MNRKQKRLRIKKHNLMRKEYLFKKKVKIFLSLSHLFINRKEFKFNKII